MAFCFKLSSVLLSKVVFNEEINAFTSVILLVLFSSNKESIYSSLFEEFSFIFLYKAFFEYEEGYEDLSYVVHTYTNSYKAKVERNYKNFMTNTWDIQDLTKDYDSIKIENNSVVTLYMGYTQTLKIKSFSSNYLTVTLQSVSSDKSVNELKEMKWYFKSPR